MPSSMISRLMFTMWAWRIPPVHHICHLNARPQFIGLRLHRENRNLAGFHVVENRLRQIPEGALRQIFQHPCMIRRAENFQFVHDGGSYLNSLFVGNDADFFAGLNAQADVHRVARARRVLGIKRNLIDSGGSFKWFHGSVHYPTFRTAAGSSSSPGSVSSMMYSTPFFTPLVSSNTRNSPSHP